MFRIITHIALSFVLLIATTGVTVSKHYCGEELIEVSINVEAEPCCGDMGKADCCHDETEYFKFEEDFVSPDIAQDIQPTDIDMLFSVAFVYVFHTPTIVEKDILNDAESPPILNLHTDLSFLQTFLI